MARKKPVMVADFILFDVIYEDGSRSSNRKVPGSALDGLEGDTPALSIIEEQDRKIGALSGTARPRIQSIARTTK
jgi:hypothetical protein